MFSVHHVLLSVKKIDESVEVVQDDRGTIGL